MRKISLLLVIFAFSAIFIYSQKITQGALYASDAKGVELGACPLKHTSVRADISGFLTRVTVTQEFENNFTEPIEAVYTFPLAQNSAVDNMTMKIGERTIRGKIMRREEAKKVYETARVEGKTASLLDQERPNIFTQAVANILPNEKILIEISYVENLKYENGVYEFAFPMVVGPRYIPGSVVDAGKIAPPVAATRAGHDISIEVNLDAGVPVEEIRSSSHEVSTQNLSANSAKVTLKNEVTIPNKDFILRFDVTGKRIEDAILTHRGDKGGFFSLILSPPENFSNKDVTPKEIVFVLDTSGSMNGFPIEKAKEAMKMSLAGLNPQDTFNLITFAGDTAILFDQPVSATKENLATAQRFLESRQGSGGTEMMKAIRAALEPTESQKHLRIVCFMTDGYVGNEAEIVGEIQKHKNARIFSFGIGNSVNRYLLDKMSEEGRGEVEYVALEDDGSRAAQRFYERVRTPLLTDVSVEWNNLPVADVYPKRNPDLFSAKPVVINGRYTKAASGTIKLRGKVGGQEYVREIAVNLPETEKKNDVLAVLWARKRIEELTREDYQNQKPEIREQITQIGLEFNLMTPFTSFVAVEEKIVNQNGQTTRVEVPVELPEGVNRETTVGVSRTEFSRLIISNSIGSPLSNSSGNPEVSVNGSRSASSQITSSLPTSQRSVAGRLMENTATSSEKIAADALQSVGKYSAPSVLSRIFSLIEAHQKALTSLNADLRMEKYNAALSETDTITGSIKYLPSKNTPTMRIDWIKPVQEMISLTNDEYVLYRPRLNQAIKGKIKNSEIPLNLLKMSKENLKKDFSLKYFGQEKVNANVPTWHLELTPKTKEAFKTIEIWVDGNGMIVQVKMTEKNGDWTQISLTNLQKNVVIKATEFAIELPEDVKIIKN
jgi:Ca-activated chloride channel homolog